MTELAPKPFQTEALTKLRAFLDDARLTGDPAAAFARHAPGAGMQLFVRYRPLAGMPGVPTVCLRLPTGGGKTVLGAMAVGVVAESFLEREFPLVLWLVPSDAIRMQTLKALRDADHPYRRALGESFRGQVRVFDVSEFANLRPQDLRSYVCVVVGTMQTLQVNNTQGRKVYAHNENLEGHFGAGALQVPDLELLEPGRPGAGTPKFSFANLMKVQRPIVILDEAHRFVTPLAEEVRQRIGPGVIVELTATPEPNIANVLYRATAAELREADMIKLPVVLTEHTAGWQDTLCEANKTRKTLAALASDEPRYLRPLLLVQAQNAGQEADWKIVKQHLIESEGLDVREIAVHTGGVRELDGVDLFSDACPVTTVITVQALKEGWDCSFAYVLCSLANIGAAQDVEQLLGRVLRMPFAEKRKAPELNKAYAHVSSARFGEAARHLQDGLVHLGFDPTEAPAAIELPQPQPLPLAGPVKQVLRVELPRRPDLGPLPTALREAVVMEQSEDTFALSASGPVPTAVLETILRVTPAEEQGETRKRVEEHNAQWSPAERGMLFQAVPRLVIDIQGERTLFDAETLREAWDWSILEHPADLSRLQFDETARSYTLDLEGQSFTLTPLLDRSVQLELLPSELTPERLAAWLDPKLRDPSMNQTTLAAWVLRAIVDALKKPGFSIEVLDRGRFVLLRLLREQIGRARNEEARRGYQQLLFGPGARVITSEEFGFLYGVEYPAAWFCPPISKFSKHYYEHVGEMRDHGEEFQCAVELDRMPEVKHWVRNLAVRPQTSFWLQTSTDRFYPDFVAELEDRRVFAVEYKGESYRTNDDSVEKERLGRLWAERSGGRAVFLMASYRPGEELRSQLRAAISTQTKSLASLRA